MEDDMRLAAQAKMGYYPTPDRVTETIVKYLKRERPGLIRVLDPCAGEGIALSMVGNHLKAETFGIEIDTKRGETAEKVLTRCLVTDYQNTTITNKCFSLLWLNPPYDWSAKDNEIQKSERMERAFLRDCVRYLCPGGILVYLIPQSRLDGRIARMLSYRFEQLRIFRFPKEAYQTFRQVVVLGRLKKTPVKNDETAQFLKSCGQGEALVPYVPEDPRNNYKVPVTPAKGLFVFISKTIDPGNLAQEVREHGLFEQFAELTTPLRMAETVQSVMPLSYGHLVQFVAAGFANGVVCDTNGNNPLLVKGRTKKEVLHSVEIDGDRERHIEREQIKPFIKGFNRNGEIIHVQ